MAAMQMGLFRTIGDLPYLPVATTGNLMRIVEAGYTGFVDHDAAGRHAFRVYGALTVAFAGGALIGAYASHAFGTKAVLLSAAFLAATLAFFLFDERRDRGRQPQRKDHQ